MMQTMEQSDARAQQAEHLVGNKQPDESERVVRVIIVEAHSLIRGAFQRIIGSFLRTEVAASLSRAQDVVAALVKNESDVLVLGSSLSVSDCLACAEHVRTIQPTPGIVVIQQHLHPETTFPIIKSGIQGLLGEDASEKDLERAITAAALGNTFLDQQARDVLNASLSRIPLHFTAREMQVLPLLRQGFSNFCIAQQLGLKEKTIEKHLTHIYEKLHIGSRAEAILRLQALHI